HNGLRDITRALGTKDYLRVRVGVGRPPGRGHTADHVLAPFNSTERRALDLLISDAADATQALILEGLTIAQQRDHSQEARCAPSPHAPPTPRPMPRRPRRPWRRCWASAPAPATSPPCVR